MSRERLKQTWTSVGALLVCAGAATAQNHYPQFYIWDNNSGATSLVEPAPATGDKHYGLSERALWDFGTPALLSSFTSSLTAT